MELHGKNIIANREVENAGKKFPAFAPAQGKHIEPQFEEATVEEVNQAMEAAEQAFHVYRRFSAERRAEFLEAIAEEILALGDELIERANLETALPKDRLTGERGRTVNQLKLFAEVVREGSWVEARIDLAQPDRKPLPKPDIRRMLIPIGPVAVFGASNFPLAFSVAGGDTASALAAGCPVVVKAHPAHPGTSELVARAIGFAAERTNMPAGIFSMLHDTGHKVGTELVKHPLTKAVGFTGSLRGGRALFDVAAQRPDPIPVYAEMGSTNPVFILPGALRERGEALAEGLKTSVTMGVGQFCTNPGLAVAINDDSLPGFINKLGELIADAPPGTMLYPGILQAYEQGVKQLAELTGVDKVQSNQTAELNRTEARPSLFTTDAQTFSQHHKLSEEVFGPSTVVVRCDSREELETIARNLEGHLTATIHGTEDDLAEFQSLVAILENKVGRLLFNGFPTGVEVCPSMQHGGPYPATSDSRTTSVGTAAISRFARPVSYQNFPQSALPVELQNGNQRKLWRLVDNQFTQADC
ncbi:MAG TPA: aldehyde dehydrogenase (NADP(+)) [Blastocatellia bacterium]|nr:aldehyde dehydrogenase (NADP(+)) [Blastocatellia bacterium]HMY74421.1 aldehyde dehydrogenase (NADP(+)) [Blastocatellia bacterium]HNG33473.1 aldehyde dehydrogenase (NADP(+)) [Blastocatellia bacterium]